VYVEEFGVACVRIESQGNRDFEVNQHFECDTTCFRVTISKLYVDPAHSNLQHSIQIHLSRIGANMGVPKQKIEFPLCIATDLKKALKACPYKIKDAHEMTMVLNELLPFLNFKRSFEPADGKELLEIYHRITKETKDTCYFWQWLKRKLVFLMSSLEARNLYNEGWVVWMLRQKAEETLKDHASGTAFFRFANFPQQSHNGLLALSYVSGCNISHVLLQEWLLKEPLQNTFKKAECKHIKFLFNPKTNAIKNVQEIVGGEAIPLSHDHYVTIAQSSYSSHDYILQDNHQSTQHSPRGKKRQRIHPPDDP